MASHPPPMLIITIIYLQRKSYHQHMCVCVCVCIYAHMYTYNTFTPIINICIPIINIHTYKDGTIINIYTYKGRSIIKIK